MHQPAPQAPLAAPPLTHPESQAERTARHLHACHKLSDLAMQLAEAAAALALQQLTQPTETPPTPAATQPNPRRPDPTLLFTSLSRAAIQAMALERRVANDAERPATNRPIYRAPDFRRPILTRALHQAAEIHANPAALRPEMDVQLDEELANSPAAITENREILEKICNGFGIDITNRPNCETYYPQLHAILQTPALHNTS